MTPGKDQMSTETDEWVSVYQAAHKLGGMQPETLMRVCGPEGARIHQFHGPQVLLSEFMRIQRDHLAYEDDQRRHAAYVGDEGAKRAEHIAEAVRKAREKFIQRNPGMRSYQGPGGQSGPMLRSQDPATESRLRAVLTETTETVGAEYDKRHKVLTFGEWQAKHGTAP
jgi:hypothetical protein